MPRKTAKAPVTESPLAQAVDAEFGTDLAAYGVRYQRRVQATPHVVMLDSNGDCGYCGRAGTDHS